MTSLLELILPRSYEQIKQYGGVGVLSSFLSMNSFLSLTPARVISLDLFKSPPSVSCPASNPRYAAAVQLVCLPARPSFICSLGNQQTGCSIYLVAAERG